MRGGSNTGPAPAALSNPGVSGLPHHLAAKGKKTKWSSTSWPNIHKLEWSMEADVSVVSSCLLFMSLEKASNGKLYSGSPEST